MAALPEAAGPAAWPLESAPRPPRRSSAKLDGPAVDALGVSSSSKLRRSFTTLPFVGACTNTFAVQYFYHVSHHTIILGICRLCTHLH